MRLEGRELWCKLILHLGIIIRPQGTQEDREDREDREIKEDMEDKEDRTVETRYNERGEYPNETRMKIL